MSHRTTHLPALSRSKRSSLVWPFCIAILGIVCLVWLTHDVASADSHLVDATTTRNGGGKSNGVYIADNGSDDSVVAATNPTLIEPTVEDRDTHVKTSSTKALADACYAQIEGNSTITYTTVQSAVNASTHPTDVVKIAGTCIGVETQGGFTQTVYISKSITLRGGYTITNWTVSDPVVNPTTLDAQNGGRVVYLDSGNVVLENLRITGGNDDTGGGIYNNHATLVLSNAIVFSNTADGWGGGVYVAGGSVTLYRGEISDNSASTHGGGLAVVSASAVFTLTSDSTISHNSANEHGGGIYVYSYSSAVLNGGQIVSNSADAGGGIFMSTGSVLINGGQINGNSANTGGGTCFWFGSATLNGGEIASNSATGNGGGVYIAGASFIQTGVSTITRNTADLGGGMYVLQGSAILSGGQIISNSADGGGGMYVNTGRATLSGGQIISNTAGQDGGGVYIAASSGIFTQTGVSTITHNSATDGGGVYVESGSATLSGGQIISNTAQDGGGVYIAASDGAFTQTDVSTISHNIADSGGGMYVVTGSVTLNGGQIISNSAEANGGGVYVWDGNVKFSGGHIISNSAYSGGGVYVHNGSVALSEGQILGNIAHQDGGGVYVWGSGASFTQTGVSAIVHNSALYGGGVYVVDGGVTLSGGQIISNSAEANGGGVFIWDGNVTLSGGQISNNSAVWNGGGVQVQNSGATFVQTGVSTIAYNTAGYGGGVYVEFGSAMSNGGQISNNFAETDGGGIFVGDSSATFTQTGVSTIIQNSADFGGGVYVRDGSATLSGRQIISNSATWDGGGVYVRSSSATFVQTGVSTITHNTAGYGGGVYIYQGNATLESGQIISNTAWNGGGVYIAQVTASFTQTGSTGIIADNTATDHGGGIYISQGNAALSGGQIIGNSADNYGGGVYVDHISATVILTNVSTIVRNSANYGGGIYIKDSPTVIQGSIISANRAITSGGGIYLSGDTAAQVLGNRILNNTASSAGGGVYVLGAAAPTLHSNRILDNTAARSGGGVYVSGSGTLSPTIISNTIAGNTSNSSAGGGGGIYVTGRPVLIQNNVISDNYAAVNNGGGIYLTGDTMARVLDNRILDNEADDYGGGVLIRSTGVYLANNVVADNYADDGGSGIAIIDSSPRLLHTTIARNGGVSGVHASNYQTDSITAVCMTNTILVSHTVGVTVTAGNTVTLDATLWGTNTWANDTDWGGSGTVITGNINIWGIPDFVNTNEDKYHLGIYSAAIDEGVTTGVTADIDGDPRPIGSAPDLGADECRAALIVSKQATPDPVQAGGQLTYTIYVTNTGSVDLHTTITDTLPAHIMTDTTSGETLILPSGLLTWTPTITAPGGVWMETFVVTVGKDYVGSLDNVVQITTDEGATGTYTEIVGVHTCHAQIEGNSTITYTTVQAAVDAADDGDTVKVAGTCIGIQTRDRVTQTVYVSKSITLRGGYTTTNWTMSDPKANPTTLDALGQGRVLSIVGNVSATVEGLHITGGCAVGPDGYWGYAGGGILVVSATITMSNNQVFDNIADSGGGLYFSNSTDSTLISNTINNNIGRWLAGGIRFNYSSGATLIRNTISSNVANVPYSWQKHYGGVIFSFSDNAILVGNTVSGNIAANDCGGVCFDTSDNAMLIGNTIVSNTRLSSWSGDGVGLYLVASQNAHLVGNTIVNNKGNEDNPGDILGGGIYIGNNSTVTLTDNIISANGASRGGGLYLSSSAAVLSGNFITANTTQDSANYSGSGGGLYLSGGTATLTNNIIADNQAETAGSGLYINNSTPQLWHTTIARNHGGDGSGVYIADTASTVIMTNTILVSHTVGVTVTAGNTVTLEATLWGTDTWANDADWGGNGTVITGNINIWGIPDFVDTNRDKYHLGIYSAAIDEGVPTSVMTDIDGDPRPIGSAPDLGADECRAALIVSKQATPDLVQAGGRLTYTIYVTNTGSVDLHTTITDTLPVHIIPGGVLTWTPTITALGGVWMETFVVTVEEAYVGSLTNVVRVTTDEGATGMYTETTWVHACYAQIEGNPTITYTTVQAAVDAADDGDTVKVTGPCVGVETRAGVTQTVYVSKSIILRGGYTINNWTVSDPRANPTTLDALGQGRVLYISGDISVTVEGVRITRGDAARLGGDPWGRDAGGGVYIISATTTLSNNQVFGNTADLGGGLFLSSSGATLNGNIVSSNSAGADGGGLYLSFSGATLSGNTITSNASGSSGGGLYLLYSSGATLSGNAIISNTVTGASGGGLFLSSSDATLINNIIADNEIGSLGKGSGLYIGSSSPHLLHTTIVRNGGGDGSGIHITKDGPNYSSIALTNTILVSHTVGITVTAGNTASLEATLWGTGTWANGTDWGGAGTITSTIDLWGDPDFVNPDAGDYHIGAGSAAISAGVDAGVTTDIDGDPRPAAGGSFDIGADEAIWHIYLPVAMRCWPCCPPKAPILYSVDNMDGDGGYTVSWSTVDLADSYVLEEDTNGDFRDPIEVYTGTNTQYDVSDKGPGRYFYRVKAWDDCGCSGWSNMEWVDVLWEKEPNNWCPQANGPLISDEEYYGYHNDPWDCFEINASTAGQVKADLPNYSGGGIQLHLRDRNCNMIRYDPAPPYHVEYNGAAGQYYICIYTESGHNSNTPYTLQTTFP